MVRDNFAYSRYWRCERCAQGYLEARGTKEVGRRFEELSFLGSPGSI